MKVCKMISPYGKYIGDSTIGGNLELLTYFFNSDQGCQGHGEPLEIIWSTTSLPKTKRISTGWFRLILLEQLAQVHGGHLHTDRPGHLEDKSDHNWNSKGTEKRFIPFGTFHNKSRNLLLELFKFAHATSNLEPLKVPFGDFNYNWNSKGTLTRLKSLSVI